MPWFCTCCVFGPFHDAFNFAGLDFAWTVEEYGNLLAIGGGKERMSHYFTVRGLGT